MIMQIKLVVVVGEGKISPRQVASTALFYFVQARQERLITGDKNAPRLSRSSSWLHTESAGLLQGPPLFVGP